MSKKNVDIDIDDPQLTLDRHQIIKSKKFLYGVYKNWYNFLLTRLDQLPEEGKILELGSGGGFLKEILPEVITSDVMPLECNDMVIDAQDIELDDDSLKAIFMIDVLHHIPDCKKFFEEAERVLIPGGKIIMSEPANTPLSRFYYQKFHHEPFNPEGGWKIEEGGGPLSAANGAIPWIVFKRDLDLFHQNYPKLKLREFKLHTPITYTLSGGFSYNSIFPGSTFGFIRGIEKLITPLNPLIAMFQLIVVEKVG